MEFGSHPDDRGDFFYYTFWRNATKQDLIAIMILYLPQLVWLVLNDNPEEGGLMFSPWTCVSTYLHITYKKVDGDYQ